MSSTIPARLRWTCRRGMLELDVLLNNFLEEKYLELTEDDKDLFVLLLESADQDLFEWLVSRKPCSDNKIQYMVDKIHQHARNRH